MDAPEGRGLSEGLFHAADDGDGDGLDLMGEDLRSGIGSKRRR